MSKVEKTSKKVASHAAKVLADKGSSKTAKQLAGSALSQRDPKKTTSPTVAKKAAKVIDRPSTKKATKSIAGSVLTQAKPTAVKAARKKPAKGTGGVGPRGTGSGGIRGRD
ncbi:hypothetical protein [Stenotrophomonas rhizophila]|uniref:hypothetical protein n=1 Tax=Stenotrophomonas rhizophila TaxID=216778 RepID=UPI001AEC0967|nr:hypothetical protein [Stenotrophomonas rhizophila]